MPYELISPPPALTDYIRYGWRLTSQTGHPHLDAIDVVADGCPGIMCMPNGEVHRHNKRLPQIILYGQSVKPVQLTLTGESTVLGICFYPDALKALFGLDAFELTDTCMDMSELFCVRDKPLLERLLQPASANSVDSLFGYVSAHLQDHNPNTDPAIAQALNEMIRSNGNITLKALQDTLRLTERSLERRFKQSVGISPKLFARICRFQAALNQLTNGRYDKLSDVAYESGYADHSHFTRTFKAFTGILPTEYHQKTKQEALAAGLAGVHTA
ncbi:helix-turn-helix transcriptional regulator [Fibrella aquatilis]|uniref:Helix-turn-helix transcriptional regulator n=1 Tax=Fibrella aquatilis TaxID=2817059 RepID=A0A939G922_9BACT|nr:helix-turn-helix transcriptional regulator [Fibrella aquatilis]MBO0933230.1 helix-turn-helix transcriptional regulator [Fibrella aquatilis]